MEINVGERKRETKMKKKGGRHEIEKEFEIFFFFFLRKKNRR